MSAQDGVTHLVATPHSNYTYTFDPGLNRQLLAELQEKVGDKPKLLLGCDFHISYDNIQVCAQNSKDFTINQTSYLLVELPDQFIPDHISRVYYDIQVAGLKPIITHPERNYLLHRRMAELESWIDSGVLVQVTAQSLLGRFGTEARGVARQLMKRGMVHFIASDAHDEEDRTPRLDLAFNHVASRYGRERAELLQLVAVGSEPHDLLACKCEIGSRGERRGAARIDSGNGLTTPSSLDVFADARGVHEPGRHSRRSGHGWERDRLACCLKVLNGIERTSPLVTAVGSSGGHEGRGASGCHRQLPTATTGI